MNVQSITPVWSHEEQKWTCGPGDSRQKNLDLKYRDSKYGDRSWDDEKYEQEALDEVLQEEASALRPPERCLDDVGAVQCSCSACKRLCRPGHTNPGWFAPGQVEKAAEYLKMTVEDFFKKYLIVEYWQCFPQDIDVIAPRRVHQIGQFRAGSFDNAPDGTCKLHDSSTGCMLPAQIRPIECAASICCEEGDKYWWKRERYNIRKNIAFAWRNPKASALITNLRNKFDR